MSETEQEQPLEEPTQPAEETPAEEEAPAEEAPAEEAPAEEEGQGSSEAVPEED